MDTITSENRSVENLLGEVANEFFQQLELGHRPDVEEYAKKYPEIAEQIRLTFPALELVGSAISYGGNGNATLGTAASDRLSHQRLGDFQIVRELGRGGMGVVYEAEQISMGRQVALKVLPFAALADEMPLRRFRNEVRAVATLDHPNIVTVYSIGEELGVHYYAMQLIRGRSLAETIELLARLTNSPQPFPQPLDGDSISRLLDSSDPSAVSAASCEAAAEDLRATLAGKTEAPFDVKTTEPELQAAISTLSATAPAREYYRSAAKLGIQAASALAHAHENGVLHRDIKPANLLLDASGNVYLTDFGLARIEADAGVTMTGQLLGTLRYMSPEQALAKRAVIDHRSDIYSLGMTLYELLALRPAFGSTSRQEILAQIAFEEPAKLRRLAPSIPGELETIIGKAIEKSPEDRYASAEDLADDLRAFLDDRPITARRPTLVHRLGKWSRRNRGLVAAGAVAGCICLVLLVVSNILVAGQKVLAEKAAAGERTERQAAERERDAAQQARDQAEDVTTFLIEAFGSPDPERDGHTVTVVEVLDRAVETLESKPEMDSLRKAALLDKIGQTYVGLGLGREAIPPFEQVRTIYQEQLGERNLKTLNSMNSLAGAYGSAGRFEEASELHQQTLKLSQEVLGDHHPDTLTSMGNLAVAYRSAGRLAEAFELLEETLKLRKEVLGDRHPDTLNSMDSLAVAYGTSGRIAEALELLEETLKLSQEVLGERHPETLNSMGNLAFAFNSAGRVAEAVNLQEQTLSLKQEVLGERHPDTLNSMKGLAVAYRHIGRYEEAVELLEQTLEPMRAELGERHHLTLSTMNSLAVAYAAAGRFTEAINLHERTLTFHREVLGERHPGTLQSMQNLASAYNSAGQFAHAIELLKQTLSLQQEVLGEQHHGTLHSMDNLASAYNSVGQFAEAVELQEQTLSLKQEVLGERHPDTLNSMRNLAVAYRHVGQFEDAVALLEETLELMREELGERHPSSLNTMNCLAVAYGAVRRYEEAVGLLQQTLSLRQEVLGDRHPDTIHSMCNLALAYKQGGRNEDAVALLEESLKLMRAELGERHPRTLDTMTSLAFAYGAVRRYEEAVGLFKQTLSLRQEVSGERHPETLMSMHNLAAAYSNAGQFAEAVKLHEQTLSLRQEVLGDQHPETLISMNNLAEGYLTTGQFEEAIELHEKTLSLKREVLGPWHTSTLMSMSYRASAYRKAGRFAEAGKLYDEAIEFLQNPPAGMKQDLDEIAKKYATVLAGAAETSLRLQQPEKAESLARESLELRERLIPEHWSRFHAQSLLGAALLQQAKADEAEQHLLDGFAGMQSRKETMPASERGRLREACQSLVDLYQGKGNTEQAERWTQTLAELEPSAGG